MARNIIWISALLTASYCFAGSCANHLRINSIANIQIDGGDILLRANSFTKGQNFNWPTIAANSTFRIQSTQDMDFKKSALAALLTAKSTGEVAYLQVLSVSTNVFQIEKVSIGESTMGLDCSAYP